MNEIRTVLCPVDFSAATTHQLDFAADLCRAYAARLVLHHNLQSVPLGSGVTWMWEGEHPGRLSEEEAEERLKRLLDGLPDGFEREARVTHGPRAQSVLAVGEAVEASLVLLTTHGPSADEHTSTVELLLDHSNRPLLVLHDPGQDRDVPHFATGGDGPQRVLVPTGLSADSMPAVRLGFELARELPIEIHLLDVLTGRPEARALDDANARLSALVPADLAARVKVHVEVGEPGATIAEAADRLGATCIVMGEHTHSLLRGWFKRDHTREVLRRAHCPVWYVPAAAS